MNALPEWDQWISDSTREYGGGNRGQVERMEGVNFTPRNSKPKYSASDDLTYGDPDKPPKFRQG